MKEIKVNEDWYKGLLAIISELEDLGLKLARADLLSQVSYLKGYAESLQTEFGNKKND